MEEGERQRRAIGESGSEYRTTHDRVSKETKCERSMRGMDKDVGREEQRRNDRCQLKPPPQPLTLFIRGNLHGPGVDFITIAGYTTTKRDMISNESQSSAAESKSVRFWTMI